MQMHIYTTSNLSRTRCPPQYILLLFIPFSLVFGYSIYVHKEHFNIQVLFWECEMCCNYRDKTYNIHFVARQLRREIAVETHCHFNTKNTIEI